MSWFVISGPIVKWSSSQVQQLMAASAATRVQTLFCRDIQGTIYMTLRSEKEFFLNYDFYSLDPILFNYYESLTMLIHQR